MCSGYVLNIADVIRHMFSDQLFARFAGTRTCAFLDSEFYSALDKAHHGLLSQFSVDGNARGCSKSEGGGPASLGDEAVTGSPQGELYKCASDTSDPADLEATGDPSDEVMTGAGDLLVLLFGVFIDGVQLYSNNKSTTTVIALKCLDLPACLVNKNLANYLLAFIGGRSEPSCLQDFIHIIVKQFKLYEVLPSHLEGVMHIPASMETVDTEYMLQACAYSDTGISILLLSFWV